MYSLVGPYEEVVICFVRVLEIYPGTVESTTVRYTEMVRTDTKGQIYAPQIPRNLRRGTSRRAQRGRSGPVRGQKQTRRDPELVFDRNGEARQDNGLVLASLNPVRPWSMEAVLICLAQAVRG